MQSSHSGPKGMAQLAPRGLTSCRPFCPSHSSHQQLLGLALGPSKYTATSGFCADCSLCWGHNSSAHLLGWSTYFIQEFSQVPVRVSSPFSHPWPAHLKWHIIYLLFPKPTLFCFIAPIVTWHCTVYLFVYHFSLHQDYKLYENRSFVLSLFYPQIFNAVPRAW